MVVAITGAGGILGTHLRKHLSSFANSPNFISTFRTPPRFKPMEGEEFLIGDLNNRDFCKSLVKRADIVAHLAHSSVPLSLKTTLVEDTVKNLSPTLNLLQASKDLGKYVHIIYTSSGGTVYGENEEKVPSREEDPTLPISEYGLQKLLLENYIRLFSEKRYIKGTILRVSTAYSHVKHSSGRQGFIRIAIENALADREIEIFGSPNSTRDYIHGDDIATAIEKSFSHSEDFSALNIGTGVGNSIRDVLSILESTLDRRIKTSQTNSPELQQLLNWNVLNIERAKKVLDWTPKISLEEGIQSLAFSLDNNSPVRS